MARHRTVDSPRSSRRALLAAGVALALPLATAARAGAQSDARLTRAGRWVEAEKVGVARAEAIGQIVPEPIVFRTPWPINAVAPHWSGKERAGATVEVSFSEDGERWSDPVTTGEDADSGRYGKNNRRYGSLVMTGAAEWVRYRSFNADGKAAALRGLAWEYIDASTGAGAARPAPRGIGGEAPEPRTFTRADWGADESLRFTNGWETWHPEYAPVSHVIIHHSDTANFEDPMVTIRSIYYYHAVTRGWGDIGYNTLVDYLGNVYEGRAGGEGAIGGHASGYNEGTCGICTMGRFNGEDPTPEMLDGIARAAAWSARWLDPLGDAPLNDIASLPVICSHRDVNPTACPGDQLASLLPDLRQRIREEIDGSALPALGLFAPGDPVATTTEGVSLREGPGLSFPSITTLAAAEPLRVAGGPQVSDGMTWYQVQGALLAGWTAADYLVAITPQESVEYAIGGMTGDLPAGPAPLTRFGTGATVEIVEAELNLRDGPAGAVLETLPVSAWLTITGAPQAADGTTWFPVDAGSGRIGWVSGEYLQPVQ
jgi:uncharacterized protein YraI